MMTITIIQPSYLCPLLNLRWSVSSSWTTEEYDWLSALAIDTRRLGDRSGARRHPVCSPSAHEMAQSRRNHIQAATTRATRLRFTKAKKRSRSPATLPVRSPDRPLPARTGAPCAGEGGTRTSAEVNSRWHLRRDPMGVCVVGHRGHDILTTDFDIGHRFPKQRTSASSGLT